MRIVQKNPEAMILDIADIGVGSTSTEGMVSGLRLLMKGKNAAGQIKRFELEIESFADLDRLQETLNRLRPLASAVNDCARTF